MRPHISVRLATTITEEIQFEFKKSLRKERQLAHVSLLLEPKSKIQRHCLVSFAPKLESCTLLATLPTPSAPPQVTLLAKIILCTLIFPLSSSTYPRAVLDQQVAVFPPLFAPPRLCKVLIRAHNALWPSPLRAFPKEAFSNLTYSQTPRLPSASFLCFLLLFLTYRSVHHVTFEAFFGFEKKSAVHLFTTITAFTAAYCKHLPSSSFEPKRATSKSSSELWQLR